MKKILHLLSTDVFSGAENVACQIINAFKDDEDYDMVYCSAIGSNKKSLHDRNVNVLKLESFDFKSVKNAVKSYNPDVIHAHDIKASIMAAILFKNKIIISHIHANHENMRRFNLKTFLYNLFSGRFQKIIWVSQSAYDNYIYNENIKLKSIVLYNVIDSNEIENKIKADKNKYKNYDIIYLGRLTYQKNPMRFINLINKLKKQKQDIRVAIVGSGELEHEVKREILIKKLSDSIDCFGFVSNPYKILASSKIIVLTSRYEGTPMVALEAIALGKPIVATPTDGLKNIVKNNKTGNLSDKDSKLVSNILSLLNDNKKYSFMQKNIYEYSAKINNIENYKLQLKKIYQFKKI